MMNRKGLWKTQEFQYIRSRRTLIPITAQKPARVSRYCQERRPGGGQIRPPGTAADQTAPANEAMRMATATPKRMLDISGQVPSSWPY